MPTSIEPVLVATHRQTRRACCAVASDGAAEVTLVHSLLEHEFSEILCVTSEEGFRNLTTRDDVAVLVLAFRDLGAATEFQEKYRQARPAAGGNPALAVMLCDRSDVKVAYELCRAQRISDYVLFWPMTHDPHRLKLAVHRACDTFERLPAASEEPAIATFALAAVGTVLPPLDLTVLVVEDHPFQLAVALSVLISAGVRATGALDARSALGMIEASLPGLILLDVDMPGMSGIEFLRLLKSKPRLAAIPVIMLTVMRERDTVLLALHEGAADFIVKPFDRDTMLQKIRHAARC